MLISIIHYTHLISTPGGGAHLQHCPVDSEGSRAPCLSWRCGCAGCTTKANYDDDDDDDDDADSDGDGGRQRRTMTMMMMMKVLHIVICQKCSFIIMWKTVCFFKFCVVFMFMMMMMLTTMMMLLKMCGRIPRHHGIGFTSQFHNTVKPIPRCMWNWFAKNNSTTPWNQFHGAVEFNCNTKAALPR